MVRDYEDDVLLQSPFFAMEGVNQDKETGSLVTNIGTPFGGVWLNSMVGISQSEQGAGKLWMGLSNKSPMNCL